MTRIEVTETRGKQFPLTAEQGRRLGASGVVTAVPSLYDPGLWDVASCGKVGVAQVGDLEVWITPKLRIDRLLFLVGYALDPRGHRSAIDEHGNNGYPAF